jgi:polygalacturonase
MSGQAYSIADFGAKPNILCTQAIQAAVDKAHADGGGTVLVPDGVWITGMITLKSGITLLVRPAAVLRGSTNIEDYPAVERASHAAFHQDLSNTQKVAPTSKRHHMLFAENADHITITGGGTLDGSGPAFWEPPIAPSKWSRAKHPRVSPMLEFRHCHYLTMDNIRVVNSPGWTIHPYCCDRTILRGVTIENDLFGPNTDGIDVNGCRDMSITDCHITCGDDAIILKATPDARSTERVAVSNCIVTTNCIGIGIGQETESDIRQVAVSNCVFTKCHRMFTIGVWSGGTVEDVVVSNCVGDTLDNFSLARPIQMEVKQHIGWDVPLGKIRNVQVSNFLARTCGRILLTAQEGTTLDNVVLRDINLVYADLEDPEALSPATGTQGSNQYANRNLEARRQRAAVVVENARDFVMDGLYIHWPENPAGRPPHAAVWARNVAGGLWNIPMAKASMPSADALLLHNVDVIRK